MGSDPDEREDKECTACTPGQGCAEAGEACGAEEVYGIYAGGIREGVANCADYVDRLIGQLKRPSRHYVAEKAEVLRNAAGSLVSLCHDVEVWLRYCGKPVPLGDSGWTDECVLAAGHEGDCAADVAPSALQVARAGANGVTGVATELADALGWLVHYPDRLRDSSHLEKLGRTYEQLRRDVDRLSPLLSALRPAKVESPERDAVIDDEQGDEAEELVCPACEFEADSIEALAEHMQERGH